MINTKLQNIIDTKSAIGNAIVNKGGTITGETPFFNYAAQIDGISTGTPQTIFQASDGSKWALTNAVNLTNVSNNVTSDFNYWQPANNSTSDPILNVGTVGANISGNIRLVPVNQVNIAQYGNIIATDTLGGKYVGFNGYDSQTNPTPTNTATFNQWLLNNSATGTVIFANATFTTSAYNGPNYTLNESNVSFINNTANYGGVIQNIVINNGFIYAAGFESGFRVRQYNESTLNIVANSPNYGAHMFALKINNGFIYAGGETINTVKKYHESNLAFNTNSPTYGGTILAIAINNGFVYAGGATNQRIQKFVESNLARATGTNVSNIYGGSITTMEINNGFIYVGGGGGNGVRKYHESNLAFVGNTADYGDGGTIMRIKIKNEIIYVGGTGNRRVKKYHESNLGFVAESAEGPRAINGLEHNDAFVYVGGLNAGFGNGNVSKYHDSNLVFLVNTNSYGGEIRTIAINNGFVYAGGVDNNTTQKFQEKSGTADLQTFYTATKIKE